MTVTGRTCAVPLGDLDEGESQRGYYYSILPNLLLNIHPDYVMFHLVFPEAPGRSTVVSEWLFHPEAAKQPDSARKKRSIFGTRPICRIGTSVSRASRGSKSKAYTPGWYTPRESLLAAFDEYYLKVMNE